MIQNAIEYFNQWLFSFSSRFSEKNIPHFMHLFYQQCGIAILSNMGHLHIALTRKAVVGCKQNHTNSHVFLNLGTNSIGCRYCLTGDVSMLPGTGLQYVDQYLWFDTNRYPALDHTHCIGFIHQIAFFMCFHLKPNEFMTYLMRIS